MGKRQLTIAEQVRAALDKVFGKPRPRVKVPRKPKPTKRRSTRARLHPDLRSAAERGKRARKSPPPDPTSQGPAQHPGERLLADQERGCASADISKESSKGRTVEPTAGVEEPAPAVGELVDLDAGWQLADHESEIVGEIASATATTPDPAAAPAEPHTTNGAVAAAGGIVEDVHRPPADVAAPDARPKVQSAEVKLRVRRPCKVCGGTDHDGRRHRFEVKATPRADIPPIPPVPSQAHDEEPETTEEAAWTSTQNIPPGRTSDEAEKEEQKRGPGRGRGVRHCRRCGRPGHNTNGCELDDSDLLAARVQDIAAACVRMGFSPAPAPRAPMPVKSAEPAPPPGGVLPTWDNEDLDAIAAMVPEQPEPSSPPAAAEVEPEARLIRVSDIKNRHRARTIRSPQRLTRKEKRAGAELQDDEEIEMPLVREECLKQPGRPCPWVRCKSHLYLDVNPETGTVKLNFPHLEVWEMGESCSLDLADRGGLTLEEVGAAINVTRERARQVETRGLEKIRDADEGLDQMPD
jgi:hypothetical protein